MSLWNRFFAEREVEEEEELEIITESVVLHWNGLEQDNERHIIRPMDREEARQARIEFIRDYYRQLRSSTGGQQVIAIDAQRAQEERRQLQQPNLAIPVDQEYIYRAQ